MTQTERIKALMSCLDLNLGQWLKWLHGLSEGELSALDDDVERAVVQMVTSLQDPEDPSSSQSYVQAIATLNDENLANLVRMVLSVQ